jgi:UDP-glucuronate decarboxylase
LSRWNEIPLTAAVQRVLKATGNPEMRLEVLDAVRKAIGDESQEKQGERWLVTGGHGYLGSLLAGDSRSKVRLYTPSREELDLMEAVSVDLYVREHGITGILHFSAPRVGNVNSAVGDSVVMLKNVLDVAVSNELALFMPSRWEVFGGYKSQAFYAEDSMVPRPNGVLGYTKYLLEMLAQQYVDNCGLNLTIVRSGLVYGRGGAPNFVNSFLRKALVDRNITTHQYLNGLPMLDMIHADDWTEGCWKILQSGQTGTFHLGSGCLIGTADIAEIIIETVDSRSALEKIKLDDCVSNIILGANRMVREFGWKPRGDHNRMIAGFVRESAELMS